MKNISELDQWELDQEIPLPTPKKEEEPCRFLKSKVVLKDEDPCDDADASVEVNITHGRGLSFTFRTSEEVTTEEVVECDLGHKHRKIKKREHTYESISISKRDAKNLLAWLKAGVG